MTYDWWNKLRFCNFGKQLSQKFSKKPQLISLFKDKKVSFDFLIQKLSIKLEDWEENSLRKFLGEEIEFHKFR